MQPSFETATETGKPSVTWRASTGSAEGVQQLFHASWHYVARTLDRSGN